MCGKRIRLAKTNVCVQTKEWRGLPDKTGPPWWMTIMTMMMTKMMTILMTTMINGVQTWQVFGDAQNAEERPAVLRNLLPAHV